MLLEWSIPALAEIEAFNIYRSTSSDGPFARVNGHPLDPESTGAFEDTTVWPETTFWYELRVVSADGSEDVVEPGIARVTTGGRLALRVHPPRPNPSNTGATLWFDVPHEAYLVKLCVYNVRGELVKTLVDGRIGRGRHQRQWNGTDESGRAVSAGAYFVKLEAAGESVTSKITVIR